MHTATIRVWLLCLPLFLLIISGCRNTRYLEDDQYLLHKNKIEITPDEEGFEDSRDIKDELNNYIRQQPNSTVLFFFRPRLWFYNITAQGKQTRFKRWIQEKLGEPPVIYDSTLANRSISSMEAYMDNKGYFYSDITYDAKLEKKRARVTYFVTPKTLYTINNVFFPEEDDRLSTLIRKGSEESYLESDNPFDADVMRTERERISLQLRNEGYYYFNKEYVYFDLDSSELTNQMDIYVRIQEPTDSTEHRYFYINNVYVHTDHSFDRDLESASIDTIIQDDYHFIATRHRYTPRTLIYAIFFRKGELYKLENNRKTINNLADLGVFKFINVKFDEVQTDTADLLDVNILLTPNKKQEMLVEFDLTNSTDYDLGTAVSYTYRNRNVFKGAELYTLNLSGGVESQFKRDENFFNTIDLTVDNSLVFNRFLVPFRLPPPSRNARPKTRISAKYNYQQRIRYYTLSSYNFSFGYDWRETILKRHIINPLVINKIDLIRTEEAFREILNRSQVLRASFSEQLIIGSTWTYIFSNQIVRPGRNFFHLRTNLDVAGNTIQAINSIIHRNNEGRNPPYKMFGTAYSQYVRGDADYRYYFILNGRSSIATRAALGVGYPISGNSEVLPYVKQFFMGGSNSLRAWRIRSLGPGTFNFRDAQGYDANDNLFFDQAGDMRLETNVEYRFDIISIFKGALFADAGNIWLVKEDTARPGGLFEFNDFYKQIALGTGVGLRLDFNFFVLRLDLGVKTRDPALPDGERWVIHRIFDKAWKNNYLEETGRKYEFLNFNLSIGYPF